MSNLVCFIASHLTKARLPLVIELFASIKQQSKLCPIYMSYSSDKDCKQEFEQFVDNNLVKVYITFLYNKKKKSQFEHYSNILKQIPKKEQQYIMFSDDDHIWYKNRVEFMWEVLDTVIHSQDTSFVNILFPNYCVMTPEGKISIKESKTQDSGFNPSCIEHWCNIVNITVLDTFFRITDKWIIKHPYCDIRFSWYILTYVDDNINKNMTLQNKPVYILRQHKYSICSTLKQSKHPYVDSLKNSVDISTLNTIVDIMGANANSLCSVDSLCSSICLNIELSILSHNSKGLYIRDILIKTLNTSEKKSNLISTHVDILYPQIEDWAKTTYNINKE